MDNLKVVIIDDEAGVRESYKRFLKREYKRRYEYGNIDIKVFADGSSGIEYINNPTSAVSIVLLDYHLPDMLGDEVLLRLRENNRNIPVVMITSQDSSEVTRATFKAGGSKLTEYIPKPPDFKLLIYTIELLCEKYKSMLFRNQLTEMDRNYRLLKEVSENWKQPMNIVSMILYRMVEEEDRAQRDLLFDSAYHHIKKASSLLDIFKDYTLLSKELSEYDVVSVIEQSFNDYQSKFMSLNIEATFKSDIESFKINGYKNLLSKAIYYILKNCAEALEVSNMEEKKVVVKLDDLGIGCNLVVQDNAGRLDASALENLLNPKYEADKKTREGMELYLSYLCLNANNAKIKCSNHSNGVMFTVQFV